jgi:moderate conductance mechanosensitive channel
MQHAGLPMCRAIACYNPAKMIHHEPALQAAVQAGWSGHQRLLKLFDQWSDDTFEFVRHDLPKIVAVLFIAFVLTRVLKLITRRLSHLSKTGSLPSGMRAQQIRTLSGVLYGVGVFIVAFLAAMQILPLIGINMGPLLASAGVAGLAIGFGAQTLVKDVVTGFFILVENQYEVGDTIKIADRTGVVELMSLRRTILRDGDGSLHIVPNSSITVVTNFTRDWTMVAMHVSVAYTESSDMVTKLLNQIGTEMVEDPAFKDAIVGKPEVPGIEKISAQEVDYLMLVKTKPGQQYAISRELRRRIKETFQKNNVQPGGQSQVFVLDKAPAK